ncbi:MAG: hypothetical protein COA38_01390 [Fluviicola sp.]|nr:MAG: hypothetical protein COA38_01390 [Fluviicola sp.]
MTYQIIFQKAQEYGLFFCGILLKTIHASFDLRTVSFLEQLLIVMLHQQVTFKQKRDINRHDSVRI